MFVKPIIRPANVTQESYITRQEEIRKDRERCFEVLQARFRILQHERALWDLCNIVRVSVHALSYIACCAPCLIIIYSLSKASPMRSRRNSLRSFTMPTLRAWTPGLLPQGRKMAHSVSQGKNDIFVALVTPGMVLLTLSMLLFGR